MRLPLRIPIVAAVVVPLAVRPTGPGRPSLRPLSPGSPLLVPFAPGSAARSLVVRRTLAGADTAARVFARLTEQASAGGDPHTVEVVQTWAPFATSDSLVLDGRTLAPRTEALASPGLRFRYRYDGRRVSGWIERGDSARRQVALEAGAPFFASNEIEPLVRSLRYGAGLTVVVPLFSETDAAIEQDTISVVRDTALADGRRAWVVRYADPVIEQWYLVDAGSRETARILTRQRRSGTVFDARP